MATAITKRVATPDDSNTTKRVAMQGASGATAATNPALGTSTWGNTWGFAAVQPGESWGKTWYFGTPSVPGSAATGEKPALDVTARVSGVASGGATKRVTGV